MKKVTVMMMKMPMKLMKMLMTKQLIQVMRLKETMMMTLIF
jgi:hypothetical protein